jgi:hypothetical protein
MSRDLGHPSGTEPQRKQVGNEPNGNAYTLAEMSDVEDRRVVGPKRQRNIDAIHNASAQDVLEVARRAQKRHAFVREDAAPVWVVLDEPLENIALVFIGAHDLG